jgi:hypothetical protein
MDLLLHAPHGKSVCMYGRRGVLHLLPYSTCISPFLSSFLFYSWVRLFFLYSMAVCVFVVCMYVFVWCGGAPLSLSLWIVAGMVVAWLDSRGVGEGQGPYCNCGDAEGLEKAITGQEGSYLPRYPSLHSQPLCFIGCSKQCIIIFLLYSLIFEQVLWRRVGNFVLCLHEFEFASQQWSVRHPDPMLENEAPPFFIADYSQARAGPIAPRQLRNVLHNRDLCRIISSFIRA